MGKAGRIACIFTPWALTIASFVCLLLISIAGWEKSSGELNSLYFFQADFTNLDVSAGSKLENSTALTAGLEIAQKAGTVSGIYQIHLWNYCRGEENKDNSTKITSCTKKQSNFWFDPVNVWGLNASTVTAAAATPSTSSTADMSPFESAISNAVNNAKNNTEALEKEFLGKSAADALEAYEKASKWMFIGFEISFWTTLATIVFGILAIFSRWGSFITWILSGISTLFTFASVLTSTVMFGIVVGALKTLLDPYHVSIKIGTHALIVEWIAVAASLAASLFWLFSVCCCSGRSNPHHKGNKGGLWNAENQGGAFNNRGRGLRVEKTGGYERVSSPFMPAHERSQSVPMQSYGGAPPQHHHQEQGIAYEPFRRS